MVEGQVMVNDSISWKANLTVTGLFQSGNVQTSIFRTAANVSYIPVKGVLYETRNSYIYQAFGGVKADEDILSLNFLSFLTSKRIHPIGLGIISTNYRREINYRYLFGGGLTFNLIQRKKESLNFSLTGEYEHTTFFRGEFNIPSYNGSRELNTIRSTVWLKGKNALWNEKFLLKYESYIQPSVLHLNNYRLRADVGFEIPFQKYFSFTISYLYSFESLVIESQSRQDQFLTFGFTLKND